MFNEMREERENKLGKMDERFTALEARLKRERERERFVGCFHTGNTHAHFAQNLRLLTQLTQYSNYTLRLIESRCIIHPKPHTNDHSREHLARDLK